MLRFENITSQIQVLILEDSLQDAELVEKLLAEANPLYHFRVAQTRACFLKELDTWKPDVLLIDNCITDFDGIDALRLVQQRSLNIPFIIVTEYVSEEFATEIIKQGADDFILKDRLHKLEPAITAAIKQKKLENDKLKALKLLVKSEENLKAVFDSATECFILTDTKGEITDLNNYARFVFKHYTERDVAIGDHILDLTDEPRRPYIKNLLSKALSGETVQFERQFLTENQPSHWFTIAYNPVKKNNVIAGICITGRDITVQKNAEQEKEFDRNNLYALINNTKDLMWSVDRLFQLITSNQAFDELVMSMSGKYPQKGNDILINKFEIQQLSRFKSCYERAFKGETFCVEEHTPEPFEMWAEVSFYPIYKGDTIVGTACFSKNITERKKAEDEMKQSNERYKVVAMATSDGIWDYDFATDKTFIAGPGYKHLFGYDIVNQYSEPFFWESRLHPDDKDRVLTEMSDAIADKNRVQSAIEYRFLKKNGDYAYVDDRFFILRENSVPVKILGAKQDITVKKNIDEQLNKNYLEKQILAERMTSILNTLPANIALLDQEGFIIEVNESWKKFAHTHGYTGDNYCINDNYLNISEKAAGWGADEGTKVARGIKNVLQNNVKAFEFEYSCEGPDSKKWFRMIATPMNEKKFDGAVIMHIDISDKHRMEQERFKSVLEEQRKITRAVLQAQEKERTRLGQELHDNISQLLAAIKMKIGFCLAYPDKSYPILTECISIVQEAMTEARNLSHRMVLPRFEENGFRESIELLIPQYHLQNRKVVLEIDRLQDKRVSAEIKETLYRILQEQLNNIEKHAKASEVLVHISTSEKELTMKISDNGIGFKSAKKNAGIGIANIFNRVKSFNGSAMISSHPGMGFALLLEIPIAFQPELP